MNNKTRKTVQVTLALFLTMVLTSTFLLKTTHILFSHHCLTVRVPVQSDMTILTTLSDNDCPICNFEFCSFLPENLPDNQKVPDLFSEPEIPSTIDCIVYKTSHRFQLRAPPVV